MAHFAVTAVGVDQPGIVAAVTGALHELGCNLEDTSMSILRGHFAMVMIVSGDVAAGAVEGALAGPAAGIGVEVTVRPVEDAPVDEHPGEPWTVSVYGADRPGIVHRVAEVLAGAGANIVDLTTRVIGDPDRPVYAMVVEVSVPPSADPAALERDLGALAGELGIDCSLHRSDADIL